MRVLHLEDSDPDAELVAVKLTENWPNLRLRRAVSRVQFEAALDTGDFDLILSDYTLNDFDGLSALEKARVQCPHTPFIFLSGTIGEERAIEALKRGAKDYIIKDRPSRLLPAIRHALARAEEEKRLRSTEDALQQNRDRFRQIAENVADLIVMLDHVGRCLYANPAYVAAIGSERDLSRDDFFTHLHPEDREAAREWFRAAIQSGAGPRGEYRLVRADGTIREIEAQASVVRDLTGAVAHALIVARDVTERRAAEERIRRQAALLDLAQDAIVARDMEDRITYWNQSAARIYGWKPDEALGRPAAELCTEEAAQCEVARRATLFYGEWMGEMRQRSRSGTELVMQSRWSLVRAPDGTPVGFLLINTDIAEKKRLEAQFLRVQRTESIGLLAGGVAHDINNVLSPIVVATELLQTSVSDPEGRGCLESIRASALHGAALVRQLMSFARGAAGEQVELSLVPLVQDFVGFARQTFGRGLEIVAVPGDSIWRVRGDATQLKQVLMNLCINARDAMPQGGTISIRLENVRLDDAAAAALREVRAGPHVLITVSDTGTGMTPEVLARIFDPFFTTKEVGKGTGLGLAAVRGIVRGHNGTLTVESELGHGASFRIFLPAMAAPTTASAPPMPVSTAHPLGNGEGILLIDDEEWVRDVLGTLLTRSGYRVLKANSGTDALAVMEGHGPEVSLILTDIMMANGDGLSLIAELRRRRVKLPIVAMSGLAGTGRFDRELRLHGVPLLSKPITREVLIKTVRGALATSAPAGR
jgi:PAS domain S-box-containing protein